MTLKATRRVACLACAPPSPMRRGEIACLACAPPSPMRRGERLPCLRTSLADETRRALAARLLPARLTSSARFLPACCLHVSHLLRAFFPLVHVDRAVVVGTEPFRLEVEVEVEVVETALVQRIKPLASARGGGWSSSRRGAIGAVGLPCRPREQ